MIQYLQQNPIPNQGFVYERIGVEASKMVQSIRKHGPQPNRNDPSTSKRSHAYSEFVRALKEKLIAIILGKEDYRALLLERFRLGGEIHLWMYDRSPIQAFNSIRVKNPAERGPFESAITNWKRYNLDTEPDGTVYKPDSLYMEASKP